MPQAVNIDYIWAGEVRREGIRNHNRLPNRRWWGHLRRLLVAIAFAYGLFLVFFLIDPQNIGLKELKGSTTLFVVLYLGLNYTVFVQKHPVSVMISGEQIKAILRNGRSVVVPWKKLEYVEKASNGYALYLRSWLPSFMPACDYEYFPLSAFKSPHDREIFETFVSINRVPIRLVS